MDSNNIATFIANGLFLLLVVGIPLFGYVKKVSIFDSFVHGAKDGLDIVVKIFPFLLGMLVAIGMLRASGAFNLIGQWIGPYLAAIGVPSEIVPLALVRPLSGSASNGILADLVNTYGGDAFISQLAATIIGSTETTFYILAIYFGAVGITKTRHAVPVGLLADFAGVVAAIIVCRWLLL